ncbi:MAG: N-acetyltransferase [Propionivibrio sp.]
MIIRPETTKDFDAIQTINVDAFADHPFSQQTEHLIVNALRDAGALTISLVAEDGGQVVGHIAFSPALIDGQNLKWFTLGPIAVAPTRQRQGIGSRLIEAGIEALLQLGANGCLLVGDPAYYLRFGFRHSQSLSVHDVPPEYFMCLPLAGEIPHGSVSHHPAFDVTA